LKKQEEKPTLRRVLGVPDGVAILIGITIGAGIYSTPQLIAGYLSSFKSIISLWVIVGVLVVVCGLIYAELGTRLPSTGGEYIYLSRSFGPFAGFMFGWAQLFIVRTYPAAGLAIVTADYLGYFVRLGKLTHLLVALSVIFILGVFNYVGVEWASGFQKVSTFIKVCGLLVMIVAGLVLMGGHESLLSTEAPPTGTLGPVGNLIAAMMLVFFSHTGWDRVGYVAGEMRNPKRVIPWSLMLGIGTIITIYLLLNLVYYRTLGIEGMRKSTIVASDTAIKLFGPLGAAFVSLLVMTSTVGSINGTMLASSRVYYAMARDRLFFKWLDFIHPRFRTPSRAVAIHCLWAGVILLVRGTFETIASGMVFAILIFLTLNTIALFKFRIKEPERREVFRIPFFPILPGVFLMGIFVLIVFRAIFEWQKSLIDLAFIATGLPFSFIWCKRRRKESITKNGTER